VYTQQEVILKAKNILSGCTQMSMTESAQVSSHSFCFQLPAYQLAYKLLDMIIIRTDAHLWEAMQTDAVTS
jgi:hypothetical protein